MSLKTARHRAGRRFPGEHRMSGEKKYYLANLPAKTDLRTLATTMRVGEFSKKLILHRVLTHASRRALHIGVAHRRRKEKSVMKAWSVIGLLFAAAVLATIPVSGQVTPRGVE